VYTDTIGLRVRPKGQRPSDEGSYEVSRGMVTGIAVALR